MKLLTMHEIVYLNISAVIGVSAVFKQRLKTNTRSFLEHMVSDV